MAKQLRAFGYARVSSDEEDGNNASIDSQVEAIRNWCERENIELVRTFEEPNVSGRKLVRKQFDRMISEATSAGHPVDMIFVYALSRFARRLITQLNTEAKLELAGVKLVSLTEALPDNSTGKMMRGFIGLVNEKYA